MICTFHTETQLKFTEAEPNTGWITAVSLSLPRYHPSSHFRQFVCFVTIGSNASSMSVFSRISKGGLSSFLHPLLSHRLLFCTFCLISILMRTNDTLCLFPCCYSSLQSDVYCTLITDIKNGGWVRHRSVFSLSLVMDTPTSQWFSSDS